MLKLNNEADKRTKYSLYPVEDATFYEMDYTGDYHLKDVLSIYSSNIKKYSGLSNEGRVDMGMQIGAVIGFDDLGCATYIAKTEQGDYIFGRNFDYSQMSPLIVHTHPENGYASVSVIALEILSACTATPMEKLSDFNSFIFAPYIPLEGMNEKGVAIAILTVGDCGKGPTNQNGKAEDIETSLALRMVLDHAASVNEALEILQRYNMHSWNNTVYHFMIADSTGASVVVEFFDNEMQIYRGKEPYNICTNFTFHRPVDSFDGVCWRYDASMNYMKSKKWKLKDERGGMTVLASMMQYEGNSDSLTLWSGVYNLVRKDITFCQNRNYDKIYKFGIKIK